MLAIRILCFVLLTLFSQGVFAQAGASLRINEFLASNSAGILDEDGEAHDWIELFNAGPDTVALAGFGLSDNANDPMKWVFPAVYMAPNSYLLVWCSSKNRSQSSLHTNFNISASGEELMLTHVNGLRLDSIGPLALPTDVSYGRQSDGDVNWAYFNEPTPNGSNTGVLSYQSILQPLQFSHSSGFYSSAFQLSISTVDTGVQIYYTLDGSEPDTAHLGGSTFLYKQLFPENPGDPLGDSLYEQIESFVYHQAIHITDPSLDSNRWSNIAATYYRNANHFPNQPIRKSRVLRAKAFRAGALSLPEQSASFFVDTSLGRSRYELPVVSIIANPRFLHDYHIGLWTPGVDFDAWRDRAPNFPVDPGMPANYNRSGLEHPVHFDYFETQQSQPVLSQQVGLRVHGDWGRALPRKAMRLYARGAYGESNFNHAVFPQQPYQQYKRLLFRNSDWGSTNSRDQIIQTIARDLGFETQAYRPVVLFVNGEYWGLGAQYERYDQHYFARKYQIQEHQIDQLVAQCEVELGDSVHYMAMLDYMAQHHLSDSTAFAQVNTLMDVENFTNYWLANIYAGNEDWPYKNIRYWRKKVPYQPGAGVHDGRWRWLMFDIDWGFDPISRVDHLFIHTSTEAQGSTRPDWSTFVARKLLENPNYEWYFVSRLLDLLNTSFHPGRSVAIVDSFETMLFPYIPEQIHRWNELEWGPQQWLDNMNGMRTFVQHRSDTLYKSIESRFQLQDQLCLRTAVNNIDMGTIQVNSISLPDSVMPNDSTYWAGIYYQQWPIQLVAKPKWGYKFVRWEGLSDSLSAAQKQMFSQDTLVVKAIFAFDSSLLLPRELVHYWHFNELPAGNLDTIWADQSGGKGAYLHYPGSGAGYLDRVNDGSLINAQPGQTAGYALRVRNPADSRALLLKADMRYHRNLKLSYAVTRTNNGAAFQQLDYRTSDSSAWQQLPLIVEVKDSFQLVEIDLGPYAELNHQAQLSIRVRFVGPAAANSSGNNRFDNVRITSHPDLRHLQPIHYWHFNDLANSTLTNVVADASLVGQAQLSYPGTGSGYLDKVSDEGAGIFNLNDEPSGDALRIRNPAATRSLLLQASTKGYHELGLLYNHMRTSNGARYHRIEYFDPRDGLWKMLKDSVEAKLDFNWEHIPLTQLTALEDQDSAQIRFVFFGPNATATSGNQRFDNVLLTGKEALFTYDTAFICSGNFYVWHSDTLFQPGGYRLLKRGQQVDTLLSLVLQHASTYQTTQLASICTGDWFQLPGGDSVDVSGMFIDTLMSSFGCDSVIITDLVVDTLFHWRLAVEICEGDSLQLPDGQWTVDTGTYSGLLSAQGSCDTLWTMRLGYKVQAVQPHISRNLDTLFSSANMGNQWHLNGQPIVGATQSSYRVQQNGSYTVRVDSNGCWSEFSAELNVLNSGMLESGLLQKPFVYPNPATGNMYMQLPEAGQFVGAPQKGMLRISTMQGKLLLEKSFDTAQSLLELDLSALPSSLYLLHVQVGTQHWYLRVVKVDD